jgi:hypothetical protein
MTELTAFVTNQGVPLVGPTDPPEIEVRRSDTQAIVQAFVAMVDQLNGLWSRTFTIPVSTVAYTFQVDADPNVIGQVTTRERFLGGSFSGDVDLIDARIDVAISTRNSVVPLTAAVNTAGLNANLAAIAALNELIEGGRDIDFAGDDALGWQRIERDTSGVLIRRYNLFDETGARITLTVPAFIAAKKMIASEVAI